jgi:hypothetical protein
MLKAIRRTKGERTGTGRNVTTRLFENEIAMIEEEFPGASAGSGVGIIVRKYLASKIVGGINPSRVERRRARA